MHYCATPGSELIYENTTRTYCRAQSMPILRLCHAVISQITTTMVVQMEEPGHQAAHQVALQPAQHKDQLRAPMVRTTRMMEPTLLLLQPKSPKRNPPCTREGSHHFQVPQGPTLDLQGDTSPAAPWGKARITSMARAMGRERKVSTRTRGGQVDTHTALPTQAR